MFKPRTVQHPLMSSGWFDWRGFRSYLTGCYSASPISWSNSSAKDVVVTCVACETEFGKTSFSNLANLKDQKKGRTSLIHGSPFIATLFSFQRSFHHTPCITLPSSIDTFFNHLSQTRPLTPTAAHLTALKEHSHFIDSSSHFEATQTRSRCLWVKPTGKWVKVNNKPNNREHINTLLRVIRPKNDFQTWIMSFCPSASLSLSLLSFFLSSSSTVGLLLIKESLCQPCSI